MHGSDRRMVMSERCLSPEKTKIRKRMKNPYHKGPWDHPIVIRCQPPMTRMNSKAERKARPQRDSASLEGWPERRDTALEAVRALKKHSSVLVPSALVRAQLTLCAATVYPTASLRGKLTNARKQE